MPDTNGHPLSPLEKDSLDGYKEEVAIHRDIPFAKKCNHKEVLIISPTQLRCPCGVGWEGPLILKLYKSLKNQST